MSRLPGHPNERIHYFQTKLVLNCPPLHEVNQNRDKCEQKLLSLLRWVLNPRLYTVKKTELDKVQY